MLVENAIIKEMLKSLSEFSSKKYKVKIEIRKVERKNTKDPIIVLLCKCFENLMFKVFDL
jgi:hypothetical protein